MNSVETERIEVRMNGGLHPHPLKQEFHENEKQQSLLFRSAQWEVTWKLSDYSASRSQLVVTGVEEMVGLVFLSRGQHRHADST